MRTLMELGLLGVMLGTDVRPTPDNNPALWRVLNNLGYDSGYFDESGPEEIKKRAYQIIDHLRNNIAYYDASELKVNELVSTQLVKWHHEFHNGMREDARQLSITICALGNKVMDAEETAGVQLWIDEANDILDGLVERFNVGEQTDALQFHISRFAYAEKLLQILDVFITAHRGMLAGVEEYAPADYQDVYPLEPTDFAIHEGNECGGPHTGCECGCSLDHPIQVLEGMEDLLGGRDTAAARYTAGVFFANDIRLRAYQGNEEGIMDSIKEMGTKAYEWCRDALKSFFDLFTPEAAEEETKEAEDIGENNKKAIQSMPNKGARINDAAKTGILNLAKATDASGAMTKVVTGLNTAADASRVIDGLQAILNKNIGKGNKLGEKLNKAQAALNELKSANDKAGSTNGDNKEVAANVKTNVSDKIAKAKASIKDVKAAVGAQKKVVAGIKKAIRGITPKIFVDEAAGAPDAAKPAEGAAQPPVKKADTPSGRLSKALNKGKK